MSFLRVAPLMILLLVSSCFKKGAGLSFAEKGSAKETIFNALSSATNIFDLSKEDCKGEGNNLLPYYFDNDKDTFGDKDKIQYICSKTYDSDYKDLPFPMWVTNYEDCDDLNPKINPSMTEVCNDAKQDEDCDGVIDPDIAYLDEDNDGLGSNLSSFETGKCMLPPERDGLVYVFNQNDCDDKNPLIGAPDPYFTDADGDGFGASGSERKLSCQPLEGYVMNDEDCNDNDATIKVNAGNPSMIDKDCDTVDDSVDLCTSTLSSLLTKNDNDKDGCFGEEDCDDNSADPNKIKNLDNDCDGVFTSLDCNDNDPKNKSTISNEKDRDCDGIEVDKDCDDFDEKSETIATDGDCDGFLTGEDCDDADEIKPLYDFDCDGVSTASDCDDTNSFDTSTALTWFEDSDGDGVGSLSSGVYSCSSKLDSKNYVSNTGDACDEDASKTESGYHNDADCDGICDGGITAVSMDENCDGICDSGGSSIENDKNCDGFCDNNPEISSVIDKDCDEICDADTDGSGNSSSFDKNCDATCDSDLDGSGYLISKDKNCDALCDSDTEGSGNEFTKDADCDGVKDTDDCDDTDPNKSTMVFTDTLISSLSHKPHSLITFDIDGDEDLDLIVGLNTGSSSGKIQVFKNDGASPPNFSSEDLLSKNAYDIKTKDLNGDALEDIIIATHSQVIWMKNTESGTFSSETVITSSGASSIAAEDIDKDGDIDILAANKNGSFSWFENDGSATFTQHSLDSGQSTDSGISVSTHVTDIDNDGHQDFILLSYGYNHKIFWYQNDGSQNFTKKTIATDISYAYKTYPVDLNKNGKMDILVAASSRTIWIKHSGNQSFSKETISWTAKSAIDVLAFDLEGDDDIDIVATSGSSVDKVWIFRNKGNTNFASENIDGSLNEPYRISVGDLDGDGFQDIITIAQNSKKLKWFGSSCE